MAINSKHPLYADTIDDQILMRDTYKGERTVKEKDVEYLPPTPGMIIDGMLPGQDGRKKYDGYKKRAVFPDYVSDAVEALLGLMHQRPAVFELPKVMEDLIKKSSSTGEALQALLRRVNEQQLVTGRVGALLDLPAEPDPTNPLPFIALYNSELPINWDDSNDNKGENKLDLVVLDETGNERKEGSFEWTQVTKHRVLQMLEGKYHFGVFEGNEQQYDGSKMTPALLRGKALEEIPFVFINSKDILPMPDNPPLLGLARLVLAIYRGEADYRQTLFLQGQDTLVVIGGIKHSTVEVEGETRVGAGATLEVDMGGDAKYIGVSSTGLPEMRQSIENDRKLAEAKSGQLIDATGSKQESGSALQTRIAAQTATLKQIALTGAAGLTKLLQVAATWMGANPDEVKITPNLEFADLTMTGKDLTDIMTAKNMGAPISKESVHELMVMRGLTSKEFEEEMELVADEDPLLGNPAGALATLVPPAGPVAGSPAPKGPANG